MRTFCLIFACLFVLALVSGEEKKKKLQIGVKKRVDPENCPIKSRRGDSLKMHYTVRILLKKFCYFVKFGLFCRCFRVLWRMALNLIRVFLEGSRSLSPWDLDRSLKDGTKDY